MVEATAMSPQFALAAIMRELGGNEHNPVVLRAIKEKLTLLLEDQPDFGRARYYLGIVCSLADEDAEAEAAFREVMRQGPTQDFGAEVSYNLGLVLRSQGKIEEAREALMIAHAMTDDEELRHFADQELRSCL